MTMQDNKNNNKTNETNSGQIDNEEINADALSEKEAKKEKLKSALKKGQQAAGFAARNTKDFANTAAKAGQSADFEESMSEQSKALTEETLRKSKEAAKSGGKKLIRKAERKYFDYLPSWMQNRIKKKSAQRAKAAAKAMNIAALKRKLIRITALLLILLILLPAILFLVLVPKILGNLGSKNNEPAAFDSAIYRYGEELGAVNKMEDWVSVNPHYTYIISYNGTMQQNRVDKATDMNPFNNRNSTPFPEDSEELIDENYDNSPFFYYKQPNLNSEKLGTYYVNDVVEAPEGFVTGPDGREYLKIKKEADTKENQERHLEVENAANQNYPESNRQDRDFINVYIPKERVYKQDYFDPYFEYTVQQEYELIAPAIKAFFDKRVEDAIKNINDTLIDRKAQEKYLLTTKTEAEANELKRKYQADVVLDEDGNVVSKFSAVDRPDADTINIEKSKVDVEDYHANVLKNKEDTYKILATYAIAKANSMPKEEYFKNLDIEFDKAMQTALKPHVDETATQTGTYRRSFSYRQIEKKEVPTLAIMPGKVVKLDEDSKNIGEVLRLKRVKNPEKASFLSYPVYEPIEDDKNIVSKKEVTIEDVRRQIENTPGNDNITNYPKYFYVRDKDGDYAYKPLAVNSKVAMIKPKEKRVLAGVKEDKKSYEYGEYVYKSYITDFDLPTFQYNLFYNERMDYYGFFENDVHVPIVNEDGDIKQKIDFVNGNIYEVDKDGKEHLSSEKMKEEEKWDYLSKVPYYPFELSYVFDNEDLDENANYYRVKNPKYGFFAKENQYNYVKIKKGIAIKDNETKLDRKTLKGFADDIRKQMKDAENDNSRIRFQQKLNNIHEIENNLGKYPYKVIAIEDYSTKKNFNSANRKAKTSYKAYYTKDDKYAKQPRAYDEPETYMKKEVDPDTGEEEFMGEEHIKTIGMKIDEFKDNMDKLLIDKLNYDNDIMKSNIMGEKVIEMAESYLHNSGGVIFKSRFYDRKSDLVDKVTGSRKTKNGWARNDWSAAFVSYILEDLGLIGKEGDKAKVMVITPTASIQEMYTNLDKAHKIQHKSDKFIPKIGDLVFLKDNTGRVRTVGFVKSASPDSFSYIAGDIEGIGAYGPGIRDYDDENEYYGVVDIKENVHYDNSIMSFGSLTYPYTDAFADMIVKYITDILGSAPAKVDAHNRAGIGLWGRYGLKKIDKYIHDFRSPDFSDVYAEFTANTKPDEDGSIAFASKEAKEYNDYIDGKVDKLSSGAKRFARRALQIKGVDNYQERMLKDRVNEINDYLNDISGKSYLMPRGKAYIVFTQLSMDAVEERDFYKNNSIKKIVKDAVNFKPKDDKGFEAAQQAKEDKFMKAYHDYIQKVIDAINSNNYSSHNLNLNKRRYYAFNRKEYNTSIPDFYLRKLSLQRYLRKSYNKAKELSKDELAKIGGFTTFGDLGNVRMRNDKERERLQLIQAWYAGHPVPIDEKDGGNKSKNNPNLLGLQTNSKAHRLYHANHGSEGGGKSGTYPQYSTITGIDVSRWRWGTCTFYAATSRASIGLEAPSPGGNGGEWIHNCSPSVLHPEPYAGSVGGTDGAGHTHYGHVWFIEAVFENNMIVGEWIGKYCRHYAPIDYDGHSRSGEYKYMD